MYSMVVVKKRSVNLKGENFSNLELPFYKVGGLVKDRFKKKKKIHTVIFFLAYCVENNIFNNNLQQK